MSASYSVRDDGVAIVTVKNPPVNSLSQAVLSALTKTFKSIEADSSIKAVVVTGDGPNFCGGAEISEFEVGLKRLGGKATPAMAQVIHDVINVIDACPKTVVAAVRGVALGGGCELSMACHYRVASSKAQFGLPEINLGLVPGGQGTQRLPRLVPIEMTLQLMLGGMPITADVAKKSGLVDEVVTDDQLISAAAKFALSRPVRRVSAIALKKIDRIKVAGGGVDAGLVQAAKMRKGNPGVIAVGECVKAAFQGSNFLAGCKVETEQFALCVSSKESAALRSLFFAERVANKIDGLPAGVKPRELKKVGVVGSGLMGGGIAMCFINKKIPVVILDVKQEYLDKGIEAIRKNYQGSRGKISEDALKAKMALLTGSTDYSAFADCDMVIEAVFEDMKLKLEIFKKLDEVCKPSCILASNTSSLDIDKIAACTRRPSQVMGTHFFSPANVMRLLENVRTKTASPETLATCQAMGKTIGKVAVLVGNCDGFVGNRMLGPYAAEARVLLEEGASINDVDRAITSFGFPMGPLTLADLVGLDLFWRMRKASGNMNLETKVSMGPYEIGDWLCDKGRFGQKTARGFFIYGKERSDKKVDPELVEAIKQISATKGIKQRPAESFTLEEIQTRLLFPMINEGLKILEEGMAQRPSDIDVIYVYGFGFPPVKGGPMHYAEKWVTLPALLAGVEKLQKSRNPKYPVRDYLKPSQLLVACVRDGLSLTEGLKRWRSSSNQTAKL